MTNALVTTVYLILFLVVVLTSFFAHVRDRHRLVMKYLIRLCLITVGWQFFEALFFLAPDDRLALWAFDLKLIFVAFVPVQLLMICVQFYKEEQKPVTRQFFLLLCIIPAITSLLAITSPLHQLIRAELAFVQHTPLSVVHNVRGPWFWVHTGYSYLLLIGSAIVVLYEHTKLPREYRKPSLFIVAGIMSALASNLFVVLSPFTDGVDFTLVGVSVALVFTYAGIAVSEQNSLLVRALDNIFSYWPDYIFILNPKGEIIRMNPSAVRWLQSMQADSQAQTISELLVNLGLISEDLSVENGRNDMDFHLSRGTQNVYFNLSIKPISDPSGKEIGAYAIVTNVTRYKLLIERVEQSAGMDPLTNLGNRRSYEQALLRLDAPESLPLSVILGDVNRLKYVNDNMGHSAGDQLLRAVAQGLREACPKGVSAYRIGGDEFVLLLPGFGRAAAEEVAASARANLAALGQALPFEASVALGIATKTEEGEDLLECIAEADKCMYMDKQNDRRSRR